MVESSDVRGRRKHLRITLFQTLPSPRDRFLSCSAKLVDPAFIVGVERIGSSRSREILLLEIICEISRLSVVQLAGLYPLSQVISRSIGGTSFLFSRLLVIVLIELRRVSKREYGKQVPKVLIVRRQGNEGGSTMLKDLRRDASGVEGRGHVGRIRNGR
jgi:hypothetical protein